MNTTSTPKRVAVVLAGAVAKGAFEAGALRALVARDVEIVRVVAASSGALNGTALAAGIRARRAREAVDELIGLWRKEANLCGAFNPKPFSALRLRGLSGPEKLIALLRAHVPVCSLPEAERRPIDLRIVVSPLRGDDTTIGKKQATTFEKVLKFEDGAFDRRDSLDDVFRAAAASSAFPFAFEAVTLPRVAPYAEKGTRTDDVGPLIDGGTVNNTPIKYALSDWDKGASAVAAPEAVVVVCPTPEYELEADRPKGLRGVALLARLVDMLINERLTRDLHDAEDVNTAIVALEEQLPDKKLRAKVMNAIGWAGRRKVELVSIRPERPLEGNPFAALASRRLRDAYLESGEESARRALDAVHWR